jgi:hypothetical protein
LSTTSKDVWVYEDDASQAIYGYIKISSASKESISFSYTRYNLAGTSSSTKSYTIKKGETLDINGDGNANLTYREPDAIRQNFEDSCWLEFICDKDLSVRDYPVKTTTTMFSVISSSSERALYRAADGASVESQGYGLYGINTNGSYIYLAPNNSTATNGGSLSSSYREYALKYGDYVITIDEKNANSVPDGGDVENSTQSYVVSYNDTTNDTTNAATTLNNATIVATYKYIATQFQSDRGPADLLKRMPASLLAKVDGSLTQASAANYGTEEALTALNQILTLGSEATDILLAKDNGLVDEELTTAKETALTELFNSQGNEKTVRKIIDSLFTQSPKAELLSPSIDSMYPYLSVNLGESISSTVDTESVEIEGRMAASVADFNSKKKAIKNKFDQYFAIELKKIDIGKKTDKDGNVEKDKDGNDKTNTVSLKDYGVKLALGVKGNLSITSSRVNAGVAGVLYMDIGLSLVDSAFEKIKKPLIDALKTEFKKTVMVGPVPLTVGTKLSFDLELKLSTTDDKPIDLAFGYIGMYGAGVDVGANWGVNWKGWWIFRVPVPYINFYGNSYTVNETEWYFGTASGNISDYSSLLNPTNPIDATLIPSITVEPLVGLGPQWANFNVSVPVKPSLPIKFRIKPIMTPYMPPELREIDLGLEIRLKAGIDIKILIFSLSHSFLDKKLVDKTGDNAWVLWKKKD